MVSSKFDMRKKPQLVLYPKTLAEALNYLAEPGAVPIAGGTGLPNGDMEIRQAVYLQDLPLDQIDLYEYELRLGAMSTLADIAESSEISGTPRDLLREAIEQVSQQHLDAGATLGGLIASRYAESELLAVLLVLKATLIMADGSETPLEDYLLPEERPNGLITEIRIPWLDGQGALRRATHPHSNEFMVALAGWNALDGSLRLAGVGLSPRPALLPESSPDLGVTIRAARETVTHPGDTAASTEARREAVGMLVKRVLRELR
jgi:CO/xanthine dehydrogenase FAD-binding subunit